MINNKDVDSTVPDSQEESSVIEPRTPRRFLRQPTPRSPYIPSTPSTPSKSGPINLGDIPRYLAERYLLQLSTDTANFELPWNEAFQRWNRDSMSPLCGRELLNGTAPELGSSPARYTPASQVSSATEPDSPSQLYRVSSVISTPERPPSFGQ
jgi:hypothetical protein